MALVLAVISLYLVMIIGTVGTSARLILHSYSLAGGEKNYLLLFQNNYELRATGGFITAFGLVTLHNGIPTHFNFEDVYGPIDDHEFVKPPEPLGTLLAHPSYTGHSFRDANVSPDFPTSVTEIESFLHKTRPFQNIDGVIAVDMSFLEYWLDAVGGVAINDISYTSENVFEALENQVSNIDLHDASAIANRKAFTKELITSLIKKSLLPWKQLSALGAFRNAFDDKHGAIFFKDKTLESIVEDAGWAGTLSPKSQADYLAVVDANYGGGKSNRYVQRSIYYSVDLEKGESILDIRYDHPGDQNIPLSTDYKGYVRMYVPQDHVVTDALYSGTENGLNFGGFTYSVPVQTSKTISSHMTFPRSTFDQLVYKLHIQKQAGTFDDMYEISVRIPAGMHVVSDDFIQRENVAIWKGQLTEDKDLTFEVAPDSYPPRVISQTLTELNQFVLEFNEPIEPGSVKLENAQLRDGNISVPTYDNLKITSYKVEGKKLTLITDSMTEQKEERYILELHGVQDMSHNELPKRTYTFVQRL